MAVIVGLYDTSNENRRAFCKQIEAVRPYIGNLVEHKLDCGPLMLRCYASPSAPVSVATDEGSPSSGAGAAAFVVGDYWGAGLGAADSALELLRSSGTSGDGLAVVAGGDGYYCAVLLHHERLWLGTDTLGFFPLYFTTSPDFLLFGTSPSLFAAHPCHSAVPNEKALVSMLMFSHAANCESLYAGVRRTQPGHAMCWSLGQGAVETPCASLAFTDERFGQSLREAEHELDAVFDDCFSGMRKHLKRVSCLLSGGQDSRLMAGYLSRHFSRKDVLALSIGRSSDQEIKVARSVARSLGWRYVFDDIDPSRAIAYAERQILLESLQGAPGSFAPHASADMLQKNSLPFVAGYFGDRVLGDGNLKCNRSPLTGNLEFEQTLKYMSHYGFPEEQVVDLLSSSTTEATIKDVLESMRNRLDQFEGRDFQKFWQFHMLHRQRYYIGSIAWRLTLGGWPVLPYIDRKILQLVATWPFSHFADRRIQASIIASRFPKLASVPLDQNSESLGYIRMSPWRRFREGLPRASDFSWRLHKLLQNRAESRFYYRVFDFNGPSWQRVRRRVDPVRERGSQFLSREALHASLPSWRENVELEDAIIGSAKFKVLSFMLLHEDLFGCGAQLSGSLDKRSSLSSRTD
ncbi:asparagine synthase-related protein [Pseudohaliea sp.]|uniref:asparagine synthase-related protein n=1 Tax=Pseudohaliea sp. TaxID=2740289 RepID=UPI0032EE8EA1